MIDPKHDLAQQVTSSFPVLGREKKKTQSKLTKTDKTSRM